MESKVAIVTGSTGQDGFYMTELLKSKGYKIIAGHLSNIASAIEFYTPDEVYNLAAISDVINPYEDVSKVFEINTLPIARALDAITKHSPKTKFFQASSALAIQPLYPYGISKRAADELIKQYRDEFGIYACSGILFPHESPRRKDHFFTKKIVNAAINKQKISVGNLDTLREFGYAPDYMEAVWLMLQQDNPKDYQIGTGWIAPLRYFASTVFSECGLNYQAYVSEEESFFRNYTVNRADIIPIKTELGWTPKHTIDDLIKIMLNERTVIAR